MLFEVTYPFSTSHSGMLSIIVAGIPVSSAMASEKIP